MDKFEMESQEVLDEMKVKLYGLLFLQDWVHDYMNTEPNKDALYRANICTYELGDLVKQIVYEKAYGPSRWDRMMAESALGDLLLMVFCLAEIKDIDIYRAVIGAVEKLANKEWTKKMSFEIVDTKKKKEEDK